MDHDIYTRPDDLPIPVDDGGCDHLPGLTLPDINLSSTGPTSINFSNSKGRLVIFIYPRTGQPGKLPLVEHWNQIAGARGCTPQTCGFKDNMATFKKLNVQVYGLSSQSSEYHQELVKRLALPFPIVSDEQLQWANALNLPTFKVAELTLIKRCAIVANDGVIEKVFYPVFPPEENANEIIHYLSQRDQ